MALDITKIFVSRDPVPTGAGLMQVFRSPEGGIHRVRVSKGAEEFDAGSWVAILAVRTEVIGYAIHIFRAATKEEILELLWTEEGSDGSARV